MTSNSKQRSGSSGRLTNADVRREKRSDARRISVSPPRRKRKRLEVTSSRPDRVTRQIEREVGIEPEQAPAPQKKKERVQKKASSRRRELNETQQLVERKRQIREARKRRSSLRRVLMFVGVIIALAALVFGVNAFLRSKLFAVTDIQVNGTQLLTRSEVTTQAAVPRDSSIPLLNTRRIEENLTSNVWIRSAKVTRKLPHRLIITIKERSPSVFIDDGSGKQKGWLVSRDQVWLGGYDATTGAVSREGTSTVDPRILTEQDRARIIPVTDVEAPKFSWKNPVRNTAIKNAVAIAQGVSPELRAQIKTISAPTVAGTAIYLKNGIEVDIGAADHLADKDTIIRQILKEQAGKVILINVCAVDKPTWRGLDPIP